MRHEVGLIGVGLMGHGLARNILKLGHRLSVMAHPGNRPLDELLANGVHVRETAADVAADADILILCVTGSPEVEAVLTGQAGALGALRPGCIVVDCSTAVPEETERMAALVEGVGARFVDAPMTRSASHAHEGKLNLLVGSGPDDFERVRPLLACFAENITHTGAVGTGHRMKLLHNFVSLGFVTLLAGAADVFIDVLAAGGGSGTALDRLRPFILANDASGLQFTIANALKDLTYYAGMAKGVGAAHTVADAVGATLDAVARSGRADAMIPELVTLLSGPA